MISINITAMNATKAYTVITAYRAESAFVHWHSVRRSKVQSYASAFEKLYAQYVRKHVLIRFV
jgi:hypothetical protein